MPQMMPINWIMLFMFFTLIFFYMFIFNYYNFNFSNKLSFKMVNIKKNNLNWKW
uniref:ATP synthase complex subunit 8 n=1 Tax=Corythoxestis sunosei TaxID=2816377 RepID=A0A899IM33_9NEOP|nr:ATP synthase F0 subunit 8 [Corythoxestis sunosei]QSL98900.1 ATP synthase F0 subunit 8 [Corythoxestis sunosei]